MNLKAGGITLLFLFTILFYSLRLSVVFIHYALFNENFTELYCVNKSKPELKCNGKCHLAKTVEDVPGHNNDIILNESLHSDIVLFFHERSINQNEWITLDISKLRTNYSEYYSFMILFRIFHPPRFTRTLLDH